MTHPDIERTAGFVADLIGPRGLLNRAWTASPMTLMARQQQDDEGGHGGKPGSRPPARLDLWSHVQTTWDDARQLCADELGVYLANDQAEECLRRIPGLLEATLGDCDGCDRCRKVGDTACVCRHRLVSRRIGQLHSTLRTALGEQEPRHDLHDGMCPDCGGRKVSVRGDRVWCRSEGCGFVRSGQRFGIGVLSAAG